MTNEYVSEDELQKLKQVLTQGLDNGAFVLSEMLNKRIQIKSPNIKIIPINDLPSILGTEESTVTAVYLRFQEGHTVDSLLDESGISGNILIIFGVDRAFEMASLLLSGIDSESLDPKLLFESALGEIGNVTGSAVLNTISDKLKTPLNPSPPAVVTDMIGSLLSSIAAFVSAQQSHIVLVDTTFINESREIKGHFFVLPDNKESILKIINAAGVR